MRVSQKNIELREYLSTSFATDEFPENIGNKLWPRYKEQINVEFPSPRTDGKWKLTAQGWVGFIPLFDDFGVSILPKIPIRNLFGMIEYAYRLKSFHLFDGLYNCGSLNEFYAVLAKLLSLRILNRGKKGFYRNYISRYERLPYLCGKLDLAEKLKKPWVINLDCSYEDLTVDLEENQILAWTLYRIARSGLCTEHVLPTVRKAYRELHRIVTVEPFSAKSCVGRQYNRLNDDYHPLHALCRFFLENVGPAHEYGDNMMIPFLINMNSLYELFVAEWLKIHLSDRYYIKSQERVRITEDDLIHFDIDLVLYNIDSHDPLCVLDTKYKRPQKPSPHDIAQIAAYAHTKNCKKAFLVYPGLILKTRANIGDVVVEPLSFHLDDDLDLSGQQFLRDIFNSLEIYFDY